MDIALNFINQSNEANDPQIVIFQKNLASGSAENAVAWMVINHCGRGENHPFRFPMAMSLKTGDSYGNFSPELPAENGQMFEYAESAGLACTGAGPDAHEVHVRNSLDCGAISAGIYKDGRLLASRTAIAPGQRAVFRFNPVIAIGAVSQVTQGEVMHPTTLADVNTELSLLGITSADIVMTGGGPGASSTPLTFSLCNVHRA